MAHVHCSFLMVAACTFWIDRGGKNVLLRCLDSVNVICQNDNSVLVQIKPQLLEIIFIAMHTENFSDPLSMHVAPDKIGYMEISKALFKAKAL